MTAVLDFAEVTIRRGQATLLDRVSWRVEGEDRWVILGPNGAGKTTMLKVISGAMRPTRGSIRMEGHDVTGATIDKLSKAGVCLIPEGRGIFPNLTVRENLLMDTFSCPRGTSAADLEEVAFARFPRLGERRHQIAGSLSGGEQQMLALARGLATDPAVLILDELSMGLAPMVVEQLYAQVAEMARTGISILVVEQFARVVLGVADRAAIMLHGRVSDVGAPGEIESKLSTAYLGG